MTKVSFSLCTSMVECLFGEARRDPSCLFARDVLHIMSTRCDFPGEGTRGTNSRAGCGDASRRSLACWMRPLDVINPTLIRS
jgi:hypothetical protein